MNFLKALLIALVACTPLLAVSVASGQGTSGSLPGPVSSRTLNRYADRLELSGQQRLALEALHAEYKRDFAVLRSGEIDVFLREQMKAQGGIPDRAVVDDLLDDFRRISAKIRALDEGLFDRLSPILTEPQLEGLPRVRMARERDRYRPQQRAMQFGRALPDLSDLVHDLERSGPLPDETDRALELYERALTSRMRKQNKAISELTANLMDALADRGYGTLSQEEILADPELLQRLLADMQIIWAELNAEATELSVEMRELNKRTCRRLVETLPVSEGRDLRVSFLNAAYPSLAGIIALIEQPWLAPDAADAVESLPPEHRELLALEAESLLRKLNGQIDEAVVVTERFWDSVSLFDAAANIELQETFRNDLTRLRESADALSTAAADRLRVALGEETWSRLLAGRSVRTAEVDAQAAADGAAPEDGDAADEFLWSGDPFLPARIGRREVTVYARRLDFDEGMREILESMHAEYATSFKALAAVEALVEAKKALRRTDPETGAELPAETEAIDRVHELRAQALADIETLERQLFEEIGALAEKSAAPIVARLRGERMARVLGGSARSDFSLGLDRSSEARVDLLAILARQPGIDDLRPRLAPAIDDYLAELVPVLRERIAAQLELDRVYEQWTADITRGSREDVVALVEIQQRFTEIMTAPTERAREIDARIIETHRRALDAIASRLDADAAFALRRQYDTRAYPDVFEDVSAVDGPLTAALRLHDLTAEQRTELGGAAARYRSEYQRLSDAMVDALGTDAAYVIGLDQERIAAWMERQQKVAQLRFERNELNAHAISRLKMVLNDDQLGRLGRLPEPEEAEDHPFWR